MKIVNQDENCMTIFLNKHYIRDLNFDIKNDLESYFKNLFLKLKRYYDINISGYYNIEVYIDDNYGLIMKLNKEEIEYYDYFDNQIDMRISIKNNKFLYSIMDPFIMNDILHHSIDVYLYKDRYYIDLMDSVDEKIMMKVIEFSDILFDDEVDIVRNSKLIKYCN